MTLGYNNLHTGIRNRMVKQANNKRRDNLSTSVINLALFNSDGQIKKKFLNIEISESS